MSLLTGSDQEFVDKTFGSTQACLTQGGGAVITRKVSRGNFLAEVNLIIYAVCHCVSVGCPVRMIDG